MGYKSKRVSFAVTVLVLAVLACQPGPAPAPTFIVTVNQVSSPPSLDLQSATPVPVVLDVTPLPTFTLEAASFPTISPTDTLVPLPTVPMVSVSVATNCRTGPGRVYDRVMVVDVGATYEVIGKYSPDDYWIIRLPNGGECWLWGEYALPIGNVNSLPELIPPPPPTPAVGAVTGTITNSIDGKKVSNVVVTAQISRISFTTGSDGTYRLDNLPGGHEFITVEDGFHKSEFKSVTISAGDTVTANFVLGYHFLSFFKYIIEGRVLHNSQPVVGAKVWVWSQNGSAITDNNGRYHIEFSTGGLENPFLILAESGNSRGGMQVDPLPLQTTIVPDIVLVSK